MCTCEGVAFRFPAYPEPLADIPGMPLESYSAGARATGRVE